MELYVLFGDVSYEGSTCLGAYASREAADAAVAVFRASEDAQYYSGYSVERRLVGAPAESVSSESVSSEELVAG